LTLVINENKVGAIEAVQIDRNCTDYR
jgi:hypothetical protein